MNIDQWKVIQKCAGMEALPTPPISLIVDSPWIPGYLGISTIDYMNDPETWLQANLRVENDFPNIIFLPGFWVEIGMLAEPSGFGGKLTFYPDKTPVYHPMLESVEEVDRLSLPDPRVDGLMPLILNFYRKVEPKVTDSGHTIKVVAARGPLAVASHILGVTNLLLGLKLDPANTHLLLKLTSILTRTWLEAQAEALQDVEGVMVLDDLMGFLSPKDYQTFAHPYLKEIFGAFPGWVKILHNDTNNPVCYPYLADLGVQIFNFTHLQPVEKVRSLVGEQVCLMGNIPPLEVLALGNPSDVRTAAEDCLKSYTGQGGFILSAGGGVSPGTPGENLEALASAVNG